MKTRGQRKKQGLQFRDDGRSVLSQIALIEDAARKGKEEAILTQRPIESEEQDTTENSTGNSEENSTSNSTEYLSENSYETSGKNLKSNSTKKEDVHSDEPHKSIILKILQSGEIVDSEHLCELSNSTVDTDSIDECGIRGVEFTQMTNATTQVQHEDNEQPNVLLASQMVT